MIREVVVSPFAKSNQLNEVRSLLADAGITVNVRESSLTAYSSLIPSEEEFERYMKD